MPEPGPPASPSSVQVAFDRAAATILGSMVALIAALSFLLVEVSVGDDPGQIPVASSGSEARDTR
jgi:hypothetical protein